VQPQTIPVKILGRC